MHALVRGRVARDIRRLAVARLVVGAELVPHGVLEKLRRGADEDGQAGADDCQVAFESRPERNVVVVVCDVGELADLSEVLEADDAADCDKDADEEGEHDADFATDVADLEGDEARDGEAEEDEVEEDVERAVDVGRGLEVGAVAVVQAVPLVPDHADRAALEGEVEDEA